MTRTMFLVVSLFCFASCAPTDAPLPSAIEVETAISAANAKFMAAFLAKDADAFTDLFTEDAVIDPPNSPPLVGQVGDAMGADLAAIKSLKLETIEVEVLSANAAIERGRYVETLEPNEAGEVVESRGSYIVYWKKGDDGRWRLNWDIWNSDHPLG